MSNLSSLLFFIFWTDFCSFLCCFTSYRFSFFLDMSLLRRRKSCVTLCRFCYSVRSASAVIRFSRSVCIIDSWWLNSFIWRFWLLFRWLVEEVDFIIFLFFLKGMPLFMVSSSSSSKPLSFSVEYLYSWHFACWLLWLLKLSVVGECVIGIFSCEISPTVTDWTI